MLRATQGRSKAAGREGREQAKRQAVAHRAEFLEGLPDGFYALDRAFRFADVNHAALAHFGATREALLGRVLWDVFPAMRDTIFQKEYERAARQKCSVAFEAVSPLTGRWVDVHAYRTRQGMGVCFRDVTDRKRAVEQLRDADRRKSEFLAILAHELRNPLGVLTNGLQILHRASAADPALLQSGASD